MPINGKNQGCLEEASSQDTLYMRALQMVDPVDFNLDSGFFHQSISHFLSTSLQLQGLQGAPAIMQCRYIMNGLSACEVLGLNSFL